MPYKEAFSWIHAAGRIWTPKFCVPTRLDLGISQAEWLLQSTGDVNIAEQKGFRGVGARDSAQSMTKRIKGFRLRIIIAAANFTLFAFSASTKRP